MVLKRVKAVTTPGTRIPKPQSTDTYVVVGWGTSRGQEALVYQLPRKPGSKKASQKRIPASVFSQAFDILGRTGKITRPWFQATFPELEADGTCNFTTLGGIFVLLGDVRYAEPGVYEAVKRSVPRLTDSSAAG